MRIRFKIIYILLILHWNVLYAQQGISNLWFAGYYGGYGETRLDFIAGQPVIDSFPIPMDFNHTLSTISDDQGNLLFYTNGVYIADASHDTMFNGSGINPGAYANFVPEGLLIPQGTLILKKPGNDSIYYMFHNTADSYPANEAYSFSLYLSVIDINGNGGLGNVLLKNHVLISDSLNVGKITACRHANGRDWWVICHRANSDKYYKLLVTPYGLPTVSYQNIGLYHYWDVGQAKFSPDGSKFAYYHYHNGLEIMDFDRCAGMLSNCVTDTTIPIVAGNCGLEFSPNSNFLYTTTVLRVHQYDMTVANVIASRSIVAVRDSFHQPGIPALTTNLSIPQLAPDGKIYITTGNGTTYFGRINNPDILGTACDVAQHSVVIPTFNFNTLPNHPNYFLGKIPGSPCDTIVGVGMEEQQVLTVKAYPNPSTGNFNLSFPVQSESGMMEIYNVNGKRIHQEYIAAWSQLKRIDLTSLLNKGIYFCKLRWVHQETSIKIIID